jgi:hypothetical protein
LAKPDAGRDLPRIPSVKSIPVVAILLLAGCSHGSSATTPAVTALGGSDPAQADAWTPLVTLRALGRFSTRCVPSRRFSTLYGVDPQSATERVWVSTNGGTRSKRTLQPGDTWSVGGPHVRYQVWMISQATDPGTITATVRISPTRCPYGVPVTSVRFGTMTFNSR